MNKKLENKTLLLNYGLGKNDSLTGDYIRGWGKGKSLFLDDSKKYLKALEKHLGWSTIMKGLPKINPGGSAVGGEVYTVLYPNEESQVGVYIMVVGYDIFSRESDPNRQISIMWRISTRDDVYGTKQTNKWASANLTVGELGVRIMGWCTLCKSK